MKIKKFSEKPSDLQDRIGAKPIVCYPNTNIEAKNLSILHSAREHLVKDICLHMLIWMEDSRPWKLTLGVFFAIKSEGGGRTYKMVHKDINNLESRTHNG